MVRLIKRYESRKLYDTEESRYVSLEEVAEWVRAGQEVRVIDNASSGDVTAQTLTQIILDEGRKGTVAWTGSSSAPSTPSARCAGRVTRWIACGPGSNSSSRRSPSSK